MNNSKYKLIETFYTAWKSKMEDYLRAYLLDSQGELLKPRLVFRDLKTYLTKFINGTLHDTEKIILLPGLRGVGKTTLLAQIYFANYYNESVELNGTAGLKDAVFKLYVSVDRLKALGIRLFDFYTFLTDKILPRYKRHKVLLLFDEIQYDDNWPLVLKIIFDDHVNNPNLLVFATGSAAMFLNFSNTDLARRTTTYRVLPMLFAEFLSLKNGQSYSSLHAEIHHAIFNSDTARQVYKRLLKLNPDILDYLSKVRNFSYIFEQYLFSGSFPYGLDMQEVVTLQRIRDMVLTNIVQKDLLLIGALESGALAKVQELLMLLASSDRVNINKITSSLQLSLSTVHKILNLLVSAELIVNIKPYASPYARVRKAPKYLFVTPNIRVALTEATLANIKGKLLEDYFALYYETKFKTRRVPDSFLLYDFNSKGADFIIRFLNMQEIVVEIGFNKKHMQQVKNTIKKTNNRAKYGLVLGAEELAVQDNIVTIPLEYWVLG